MTDLHDKEKGKKNRQELEDEINKLTKLRGRYVKEYTKLKDTITPLGVQIKELQRQLWAIDHDKETLDITDHALMRWMERHMGVNRTKMAEECMRLVLEKNPTMKPGETVLPEFTAVIVNHTVVTIL